MTVTAPVDSPAAPAPGPAAAASIRLARRERLLRRRRKTRLAGAGFLALLVVTGCWLLLLNPRPRPHFVSFALTEYDYLPSNPFAQQDSVSLRRRFGEPGADAGTESDKQQRGDLLRELNALRDSHQKVKVLVVHLCAHAWADEHEVYLVATNGRRANPAVDEKLSELLQTLKLLDDVPKLLLLDVMRPLADPRRGVVINDVADRVPALVKSAAVKRLVVLTACSSGEESLTSEELRQSVFAYYAARGLAGEADGYRGGTPDRRVGVQELYRYVSDHVDQWARQNRGVRQQPRLLSRDGDPAGDDFPLVVCDSTAPGDEEPSDDDPYPGDLLAAWRGADSAWAVPRDSKPAAPPAPGAAPENDRTTGEAQSLLPSRVLHLQAALLDAEQRWRFGARDHPPLEKRLEAALRQKRELKAQLERARDTLPVAPEVLSLAWAERAGRPAPDEPLREAARQLLVALRQLPAFGNPMREAKQQEAIGKFCEAQKDPELLTRAAFDALDQSDLAAETVIAFDGLLNKHLGRSGAPSYVETALVRRLASLANDGLSRVPKREWPTESVRLALRATRAAAWATSRDPRGWRLAEARLTEAADLRRRAESRLFDPPRKPNEAAQLFEQSLRLYEAEGRRLEAYAEFRDAYEKLLTLLVASPPQFCELGDDRPWKLGYEQLREAARALAEDELSTDRLSDLRGDLNKQINSLGAPFKETAVAELIGRIDKPDGRSAGPDELRKINALLQTPLLRAKDRAALWEAGRRLGRRLLREPPPPRDSTAPPQAGREAEARRADCRFRTSFRLASLAFDDGKAVPPARSEAWANLTREAEPLARGAAPPPSPAERNRVARDLAEAWSWRPSAPSASGPDDEKLLLAADRGNRILHAAGDSDDKLPGEDEPSLLLRRRQARDFWSWLAKQYRLEKDADKEDGTAAFYRGAADRCAEQAEKSRPDPH